MLPLPTLKKSLWSGRRDLAGLMTMVVTIPAFLLVIGRWNWPVVIAFSLFPLTYILWTLGRATLLDLSLHPAIRLFEGNVKEDTFRLWDGPERNVGSYFLYQGASLILKAVPSNDEILMMYRATGPVSVPKNYFPSFFDSEGAVICFIGSGAEEGTVVRMKAGSQSAEVVAPSVSEFIQLLTHVSSGDKS